MACMRRQGHRNRCRWKPRDEDEVYELSVDRVLFRRGKVPPVYDRRRMSSRLWRRASGISLVRIRLLAARGWPPTEIERLSGVARFAAAAELAVTAAVLMAILSRSRGRRAGDLVTESRSGLARRGAGGALGPNGPSSGCLPRKAAATPARPRWNGASIPRWAPPNWRPTPTLSSPPRWASPGGGLALRGANRGAAPGPVLLGGPRSWVPGCKRPAPFRVKRLQRSAACA